MSLFFKKKKEPVVVPDLGPQNTARKDEKFRVAGMNYRQDAILKLGKKNPDYLLKSADLKKKYQEKPVFEYTFPTFVPELIAEPDNEYDPNAIAIYANGEKVGYVKKGSTARVRNIMKDRKLIGMKLLIGGGNRRWYDYMSECVEKDTGDFWADLVITHAEK